MLNCPRIWKYTACIFSWNSLVEMYRKQYSWDIGFGPEGQNWGLWTSPYLCLMSMEYSLYSIECLKIKQNHMRVLIFYRSWLVWFGIKRTAEQVFSWPALNNIWKISPICEDFLTSSPKCLKDFTDLSGFSWPTLKKFYTHAHSLDWLGLFVKTEHPTVGQLCTSKKCSNTRTNMW